MMRLIWLALLIALVSGCGSGDGTAAGTTVQPSQAVVTLGTQASSAATVIYAVAFTLHLPAGVTVAADSASGEVSPGALQVLNGATKAAARYLPATAGTQATVQVAILNPGGFAVGDLATLTCAVSAGTTVTGAGFSLDGFSARDANGAELAGITPHFAVRMQ